LDVHPSESTPRAPGKADLESRPPTPADVFRRQPANAPLLDQLDVRGTHSLRCRLRVPGDLPIFTDHFPAVPIVPAVLQIGWVVDLARSCLQVDEPFRGILVIKFRRPVRPGMVLDVSLENHADRAQVEFDFTVDGQTASSGRLSFGSSP
jgi:3-hydroxymyristoyl/3-hydroxydecanoyl-(acyl carrier protein) dehydratase